MQIIKEHCPKYNSIIIRTRTYTHSYAHFENLFNIANQDFPGILKNDVEVLHYSGQNYKGTYGIEFVWDGVVPEEYKEVSEPEDTL